MALFALTTLSIAVSNGSTRAASDAHTHQQLLTPAAETVLADWLIFLVKRVMVSISLDYVPVSSKHVGRGQVTSGLAFPHQAPRSGSPKDYSNRIRTPAVPGRDQGQRESAQR
jgi:hypothetical protein